MKARIFISCAATLLTLVLIELLMRSVFLRAHHAPRTDRPHRFYVAPEHRAELELIEKEQKRENTFRIAAVGDSFTFGPGLQADDTYPKHLERLLNLQVGAPRVEVFNLGIPGYSTHHEIDSVRAALRARADLVVLSITLNDPQLVSLQLESDEVRSQFGRYQPSDSLRRIFQYWKTAGYVAERLHNRKSVQSYIEYHRNLFQDPLSWGRFAAAIQRIKSETARSGIPLFVMVFPLLDFPLNKGYPFFGVHKQVDEFLHQQQIPFVDLLPAFRNMDQVRLQIVPGRDSHPNEIAHRIASERLFSALIAAHLVPDACQPGYFYPRRDDPRRMQVHPMTSGVQLLKNGA